MRTVAEVSGCLIYQFELDGKTYLASSQGGLIEHKPLTSGEDLAMLVEDPVHLSLGKWYFWGETGRNEVGPYDTEEQARRALKVYVESI